MGQLLSCGELHLGRDTLSPAVTFMGGWVSGIPNPMQDELWMNDYAGADQLLECYCVMDAEQLCAAANAQGLSAASEKGSGAQCSPHALTISWPDASG